MMQPTIAGCANRYCAGRAGESVLGQAGMSSNRDHNVIWTLRRYLQTARTSNLGMESGEYCDLDHGLARCASGDAPPRWDATVGVILRVDTVPPCELPRTAPPP